MRTVYLLICLFITGSADAQTVKQKLESAIAAMQKDPQFIHATIGLYVIDGSGATVFAKNEETGMAPASTQKVITSVTGFEILGNDFTYKTLIGGDGAIKNNTLNGNLHFIGSGDPTLGSWRWKQTRHTLVMDEIVNALKKQNITRITGGIYIDDVKFTYPTIPEGWIWQDIGNYYGAGAWGFNFHENQYDLHLRSGEEVGGPTYVVETTPVDVSKRIHNYITAGKKGSGDNAYLFAGPYDNNIIAIGTIPAGEKKFIISGSIPDPGLTFSEWLTKHLRERSISITDTMFYGSSINPKPPKTSGFSAYTSITSPTFDSMNYWFMQRSINLYGEAFIKTMAIQKGKSATTDDGTEVVREFWSKNGIEKSALKIKDGSGLSPANRITPKALVQVLRFAQDKSWYNSFYKSVPTYNGIKMKSGTIGGVKAFTGYLSGKNGEKYIFAFIINNYDGSANQVRDKMYKVLDLLK